MRAFITGSRAYGKPTPKSDIDLVIIVSPEDAATLRKNRDSVKTEAVRYGKLNLIICESEEEYLTWATGTTKMRNKKLSDGTTFDKKVAKTILDEFREIFGVEDEADSGA